MKYLAISGCVAAMLMSSCKSWKPDLYADDMYSKPAADLQAARVAAAEQAKKQEEEKKKAEAEALAQKAKDDANPYYKDPSYSSDDYYDYQYASKLRRYYSPVSGAGYYDNYYTNSYYYNNNPYSYGTSIYSTYNWYMPSSQFSNLAYGVGVGTGYGSGFGSGFGYNSYGNYGYNPYGYSSWGYPSYGYGNCWNSYGYSPYGYGYSPYGYGGYGYNNYGYNPWYSGYNPYGYGYGYGGLNNGWGYFNGYDPNSEYGKMSYGPRTSNGGGNSERASSAGMQIPDEYRASERQTFFQSMAQKQEQAVRFTEVPRPHPSQEANINNGSGNMTGPGYSAGSNSYPHNSNPGISTPGSINSGNANPSRNHGFWGNISGAGAGNQQAGSSPTRNNGGYNTGSQPGIGVSGESSGSGRNGRAERIGGLQNNDLNMQGGSQNRGNWGGGGGGGVFPSGGGISAPRGGGGGGGGRPR